jgi:hypothetical protein
MDFTGKITGIKYQIVCSDDLFSEAEENVTLSINKQNMLFD